MNQIIGEHCLNNKGKVEQIDLESTELVGIYYSASWCRPCLLFTPRLKDFYLTVNQYFNKQHQQNNFFEVFFASFDYNKSQFEGYFQTMVWKAFPFENRVRANFLMNHFRVRGFPCLVVLGKDGTFITNQGIQDIDQFQEEAVNVWLDKLDYINQTKLSSSS